MVGTGWLDVRYRMIGEPSSIFVQLARGCDTVKTPYRDLDECAVCSVIAFNTLYLTFEYIKSQHRQYQVSDVGLASTIRRRYVSDRVVLLHPVSYRGCVIGEVEWIQGACALMIMKWKGEPEPGGRTGGDVS